jgi:hypothetical protein
VSKHTESILRVSVVAWSTAKCRQRLCRGLEHGKQAAHGREPRTYPLAGLASFHQPLTPAAALASYPDRRRRRRLPRLPSTSAAAPPSLTATAPLLPSLRRRSSRRPLAPCCSLPARPGHPSIGRPPAAPPPAAPGRPCSAPHLSTARPPPQLWPPSPPLQVRVS